MVCHWNHVLPTSNLTKGPIKRNRLLSIGDSIAYYPEELMEKHILLKHLILAAQFRNITVVWKQTSPKECQSYWVGLAAQLFIFCPLRANRRTEYKLHIQSFKSFSVDTQDLHTTSLYQPLTPDWIY